MSAIHEDILGALHSVVGAGPVRLHEPVLGEKEREYLQRCIDSAFVSSVGEYVDGFERSLEAFTGAKHAVVVVNGTAALHVALHLVGVRDRDEVIVPALTFVATAAAVKYCGAVPLFADCEASTIGLCPRSIREWLRENATVDGKVCRNRHTGRTIKAIIPMHTFGHPCDLDGLLAVAEDYGLVVVEDAAEALGSTYRGKHVGTLGRIGTLSFNGNKIVTTGGGGAILTDDPGLARRAKHITTTSKKPHPWLYEHDEVGFNYRMPNINAALGCAQLERMPEFLASKRRLHERYKKAFGRVKGVELFEEPASCNSNQWLQALILEPDAAVHRDRILQFTNEAGVMTRPVWTLMNRLSPYRDCPAMPLPVAESLEQRIVNIPSSAGIA